MTPFQLVHPEMQAVIEGLDELVCLVGSDGTILSANRPWRESVERRGALGFRAGENYPAAVAALIEAGDERLKTVWEGFQDVRAGRRRSSRCIYVGSGILAGHDYNVLFSALESGGERLVLVNAHDLTEVNTLKRQRRRLGSQVLRAQERERRRMARELHDSTAQSLVALQLDLINLGHAGAGAEADALIADCKKAVEEVQQQIRSLSFLAHPPSLSAHGLGQALEALTAGFSARTGLEVDVQISDVGEASDRFRRRCIA